MSDNYIDETRPLFKLLRTPAFRFFIVSFNHYSLLRRLQEDIKNKYPHLPSNKIDVETSDYKTFSDTYFSQKEGFLWLENFDDTLKREADMQGAESPQAALNNERRSEILIGLNLRRDKLAKYPVALFICLLDRPESDYIKKIIEKMPDLWSFRSLTINLQTDYSAFIKEDFPIYNFLKEDPLQLPVNYTSLGGDTIEEKKEELHRIKAQLNKTPESEIKYREALTKQINELENTIQWVTTGTINNTKNSISQSNIHSGRDVHIGDNHYHNNPDSNTNESKPNLTPPPPLPHFFVGRKQQLQDIRHAFFHDQSKTLLLCGEGGIGKSSLAARYYHDTEAEYHHRAWLSNENNIAFTLLQLIPALGLHFDEKATTEERLNGLFTAMQNLPAPCLLVIDNADNLEDLKTNYLRLQSAVNFHVLITTRLNYDYAAGRNYLLKELPEDLAIELFRQYYPKLNDSEVLIAKDIYHAVNGNTLVMELLAKNLNAANRYKPRYSLHELLADLQQNGLLQLSHAKQIDTLYGGSLRSASPHDILKAMYDLSNLSPDHSSLLSVFAVLPSEFIPLDKLEELLPDKAPHLDDLLYALHQQGWITLNENVPEFRMNPVVQEVIRFKNAGQLGKHILPLVYVMIKKLEYEAGTGHFLNATYEEAARYARYATSIINHYTEVSEASAILCERIGNYHKTIGNLTLALSFFEQYLELTKVLYEAHTENIEYKSNFAIAYEKLGSTHSFLGQLTQALAFFEEYFQLRKSLYESYPGNVSFINGLAIAYEKLGETHNQLGNLTQALAFYEKDIYLTQSLYESYPDNMFFKNGLAIAYSKLGDTHSQLGHLTQALTFFELSHELTKTLYESYPENMSFKNGLAYSYSKLGDTHSQLGHLTQALAFFELYNGLTKTLYEAYPENMSFKNGLTISYAKLGLIHLKLEQVAAAVKNFKAYYEIASELFAESPNYAWVKSNYAEALAITGALNLKKGKSSGKVSLQEAKMLFDDLLQLSDSVYYRKKSDLVAQMMPPDADLLDLIIQLSAF